ncbi:MAG: Uma2 family endonuclease [Rhodothermales bacterium]
MMNAIEALLQSPRLPEHLDTLQTALADEQTRRTQFYHDLTPSQKAEFINGEVVMHSPAKLRHHEAGTNLLTLLRLHVQLNGLGWVGHEKILVALTRNDYEPSVCFFRQEVAASFTEDQMRFPAPDFIAEVLSPSTAVRDRGVKFEDYAAHGVGEYWIIDAEAQVVEQYVLAGEVYQLHAKLPAGEVTSRVIEGFTVPVAALFDAELNLATMRRWLQAE